MALISAHRCGADGEPAYDNTLAGVARAAEGEAEFVEFDVQRCADGTLVLGHDDVVLMRGRSVRIATLTRAELARAAGEVSDYADALAILAGRKHAHIDLKFTSPEALYRTPQRTAEARAAQLAADALGDRFMITSLEDRSVRAVRDWCDGEDLAVPVGLSLGRGSHETPWLARPGVRLSELAPARRMAASRANVVVAHHRLARVRLAGYAGRAEFPLVVWTVDEPRSLRRWLRDPRVWLVTTNRPELGARIRAELTAEP